MYAMTLDDVKRIYDARASIPFDGSTNRAENDAALSFVDRIAPDRDVRILDAGCGTGWFILRMSRAGYRHLYGVDLSAVSLQKAAELCTDSGAILILGDIGALPPAKFDIVTALNACVGCFGREGDQDFIDGLQRALIPGGHLVLSYVGAESAQRRVGDFEVSYDGSDEKVVSSVRLEDNGSCLVLRQVITGQRIPDERIAVLKPQVIDTMLRLAGFESWEHIPPRRAGEALRYVDIIIASKLQ